MGRKHSYAFHGCIRLDRLCASKRCALRYCTSKKGGEFLVQACSQQVWDTTIGMLESWCLLSKITHKPLGPGGVDVHIDEFAMHQLEESIHFATTRHESKTVLNDVISVTASMQTQETKWNDSHQAFISKSRLWRISTIIDQLEPLIDDPLLLSDYPTQEGSDLPAMRAWISASTSPPMRSPIHCVGPMVALDRDGTRSVMSDQPGLIRAEGCPMDTYRM